MFLRSLGMSVLNFPTPVPILGLYGIWKSRRLLRTTPLAAILGVMLTLSPLCARYRVPNQNFFSRRCTCWRRLHRAGGIRPAGPRRAGIGVLLVLAVLVIRCTGPSRARHGPSDFHSVRPARCTRFVRDVYAYFSAVAMPSDGAAAIRHGGPRRPAEGAVLLPDTTTAPPLKCLHDVERERPEHRSLIRTMPSSTRRWRRTGAGRTCPRRRCTGPPLVRRFGPGGLHHGVGDDPRAAELG